MTATFAIPGQLLPTRQVQYRPPYDRIPTAVFNCYGLSLYDGVWEASDHAPALKVEKCWGPASGAGLLPNDYIVGFNHVTVEDFRAALTLLMDPPASGEVTILVERGAACLGYAVPRAAAPDLGAAYPFLTAHQKRCAVCFAGLVVGGPTPRECSGGLPVRSQSEESQRRRLNSVPFPRKERDIERKLEVAETNRLDRLKEAAAEREARDRRWTERVQQEKDQRSLHEQLERLAFRELQDGKRQKEMTSPIRIPRGPATEAERAAQAKSAHVQRQQDARQRQLEKAARERAERERAAQLAPIAYRPPGSRGSPAPSPGQSPKTRASSPTPFRSHSAALRPALRSRSASGNSPTHDTPLAPLALQAIQRTRSKSHGQPSSPVRGLLARSPPRGVSPAGRAGHMAPS
eukprot:EG_transcript_13155